MLKTNIPNCIKEYIQEHFNLILQQNQCTDLCEFGAFFYLESTNDIDNYSNLGLPQPIINSLAEFTKIVSFKSSNDETILFHSCFVICDSYAISIFAKESILSKQLQDHLLLFN